MLKKKNMSFRNDKNSTKAFNQTKLRYRNNTLTVQELLEMRNLLHDIIEEKYLQNSSLSGIQIFNDMLNFYKQFKPDKLCGLNTNHTTEYTPDKNIKLNAKGAAVSEVGRMLNS